MKIAIALLLSVLSSSIFAASLCNITLMTGKGESMKHLATITKYVKIAEGGAGTIYKESEDMELEVIGVINDNYNAEINIGRIDVRNGVYKNLGGIKMTGVNQTKVADIDGGAYSMMLSCVSIEDSSKK